MENSHDGFLDFAVLLTRKGFLGHIARGYGVDYSELVNEICLLFPGRESSFAGANNTDAYLAVTARNVAMTLRRKQLRFRNKHSEMGILDSICVTEFGEASNEVEKWEVIELCRAAIGRLPVRYRCAVEACFLNGQSPREYAKLQNIAYENVRALLRRAKLMLKSDVSLAQSYS